MATINFWPLANDLINLVDTFAKTTAILDSGSNSSLPNRGSGLLNNVRSSLHQAREQSEDKGNSKSIEENTSTPISATIGSNHGQNGESSSQNSKIIEVPKGSDVSRLALNGIAAEVQILRGALLEPVQAINTLLSMYIIESFEEPLLQLLTAKQCAQLLEAISLADVASELDKQLRVLQATADDHGREHDFHLELVRDIRMNLVDSLTRLRSFAARHTQAENQKSNPTEPASGDLLELSVYIQNMYNGLLEQPDIQQNLLDEQERIIFALKLFLEDKVDRFKERWRPYTNINGEDGTMDQSASSKAWPSATIPTAQLATLLFSRILPHLNLHCSKLSRSHNSGEQPQIAETTESRPTPPSQDPENIEQLDTHMEDAEAVARSTTPVETSKPLPSSSEQPATKSIEAAPRITPHVTFSLPKFLDKRRDSAISLLSSVGKPELLEVHEDETLPDNDASECGSIEVLEPRPDSNNDIEEGSSSIVATQEGEEGDGEEAQVGDSTDEIPDCEDQTHEDGTSMMEGVVMDEIKADQQPSYPEDDTVEDLYSADDGPTLPPRPPPATGTEQTPNTSSTEQSHCHDRHESHAIPFLSTNWPQRAWLQSILSVLAPGPEAHLTSPLSPSFPAEALASPPPNPSSSEWYSGYDAWWSFAMRGGSGRNHDESESESTTTSTSEQSWGVGSRSTEADSIDS